MTANATRRSGNILRRYRGIPLAFLFRYVFSARTVSLMLEHVRGIRRVRERERERFARVFARVDPSLPHSASAVCAVSVAMRNARPLLLRGHY